MPLAEREFYLELRRVIGIAGFTVRVLQDLTFSARSGSGGPAFYSKSQWSRWINGRSQPPRKAVVRLAEVLAGEGIDAGQLAGLWDRAFTAELAEAGQVVSPRQLPAGIAHFTGRDAELDALTGALDMAAGGAAGTVVISAIGGMGGVGKTALALHWAHRVAGRFGDGQLYVNLRGFDPGGVAVTPAEAVRAFLDALGVPAGQVPHTADGQAGLYRSLLADRKMLIVLDNARDEQQVRPLLPASPGSLVLVTSRSQLAGLAAADGAHLLTLDVLAEPEARQLLAARIGRTRADTEPAAITQIAQLCGYLPLGLAIAAARAAARPRVPLSTLADELRDTASRLDLLDAGDHTASIRAVFSWSYQQLTPSPARMFRLLSIHPGPDITAPAAASLAGTTQPEARRLLATLTRAHLTAEHTPGRYTLHDLLRAYATEQARATDNQPARDAATTRVLDHYLHTAHTAATLINPTRDPITLPPAQPGVTPEHLPGHQPALTWLQAEHHVLLAATTLAAETGSDTHAWQLPWTMADFQVRRGEWQEMTVVQHIALAATTRLGDMARQAESRRHLGQAYSRAGDHAQVLTHCLASLDLCQQIGDRLGEARVHQLLLVTAASQGRYADALTHADNGLRLFQAIGDRSGEARMLNNLGYVHALLGDYQRARAMCRQALTLLIELGLRDAEAHAWDSLGYAEYHLGQLAEAATCYQRALSLFRELGDRYFEANSLNHLGDTRYAAGQQQQALDAWRQALTTLDDLQHGDAREVRAKLAGSREPAAADALPL
jgi:tetratricopeptide (TPR) repeat protein